MMKKQQSYEFICSRIIDNIFGPEYLLKKGND
ncbi:hypothetical protein SOV_30250 [Sporomusa ovata DSM 2662]|nr:hypothetical protein SOV_5c01290 [Sporomusa ovata DSM 2662]